MTTRTEFAARRNDFFATMTDRFSEAQSAANATDGRTARERNAIGEAMRADYSTIEAISAMDKPAAEDFARADAIFVKHGV